MDWLQFFASVFGSLAWPVAVVGIVLLLREPLGKLLPLIRTLKYKELQIDLAAQLEEIKVKAEAAGSPPPAEAPGVESDIAKLADVDTRGAILAAWIPVERQLREFGRVVGFDQADKMPPGLLARVLHRNDHLDDLTFDSFEKLRKIRNEAVHMSDREIAPDAPVVMAQLCSWVGGRFRVMIDEATGA